MRLNRKNFFYSLKFYKEYINKFYSIIFDNLWEVNIFFIKVYIYFGFDIFFVYKLLKKVYFIFDFFLSCIYKIFKKLLIFFYFVSFFIEIVIF